MKFQFDFVAADIGGADVFGEGWIGRMVEAHLLGIGLDVDSEKLSNLLSDGCNLGVVRFRLSDALQSLFDERYEIWEETTFDVAGYLIRRFGSCHFD